MKWNKETVIFELEVNKDKNPTWFHKNKSGLVRWCRCNGGWLKWQKDYNIVSKNFWTEKQVIDVFNQNKSQPLRWFYDNYSGMIQWCIRNGGIRYWKAKVNRESRREFTTEFISEFLQSHKKENYIWFRINEPSIVNWCNRNGTWKAWMNKFGIKEKDKWNEKKVTTFLKTNSTKSYRWFKENTPTLIYWCSCNGGWTKWANKSGVKTCKAVRTKETVLEFFKQNKDKNLIWFINNEPALARWCYRQEGGLKGFAEKAGIKVDKNI